MKRVFVSIILILFAGSIGFAQITTTHIPQPLDSTKNFYGDKCRKYIGQVLYVKGLSESLQGYGYDNFKTEKEPFLVWAGRYGSAAQLSQFNTKYEDLAGKYFKVLDVQPDSRQALYEDAFGHTWWFLLQNRDNEDDAVWYMYDDRLDHFFPFITVSYFNYLKDTIVGKKYYSTYGVRADGTVFSRIFGTDFYTGKEIPRTKDDIWECIDVTIEDKYYSLVVVAKNQNGYVSSVQPVFLHPISNGQVVLFEEEEYKQLCQTYGESDMDLVRGQNIRVGMPESLLIMSWGTPDRKVAASKGREQWIYEEYRTKPKSAYVKDGKVTAFN